MLSSTHLLVVMIMALLSAAFVHAQSNPNSTAVLTIYGDAGCSMANYGTFIPSMPTNGQCFAHPEGGVKVTCDRNGNATYSLYEDISCSTVSVTGSGVGDGRTCLTGTVMPDFGLASAFINCDEPQATNEDVLYSTASTFTITCAVLVLIMSWSVQAIDRFFDLSFVIELDVGME
jgi:hypothetical protein